MDKFVEHAVDLAANVVGLEENKRTLITKKEEISARESDIKAVLKTSVEQGKRPTEEVRLWLEQVEQFKSEVSNIISQVSSSKYRSYPTLAQVVVNKIKEADSLLLKERFPNGLAIDHHQPDVKATSSSIPLITVGRSKGSSSLANKKNLFKPPISCGPSTMERTTAEIMVLLENPEIGKIGVYGMAGTGKTTIMKNIKNKLANTRQFDQIIWVTASEGSCTGSMQWLQKRIARELGHDFCRKLSRLHDEESRAAMLSKKLQKQANKFLLVLDDLRDQVTLERIGILEPSAEKKGSYKIVVITRFLCICDFIETQANVEVKCLSDEEAWELFVSTVGGPVLVPEIQPLAREVVRECGGIPIALITVGRATRRNRNIKEWRYNLKELQSSGTLGMYDKVFKHLKFCYDHLREDAKKCFLYCAFFPVDEEISADVLIDYWIAEGFMNVKRFEYEAKFGRKRRRLHDDDQYVENGDWEEERDKGVKILQELKDACMLESIQREEEYLRMHDLMRVMASTIMREDFGFISAAGLGLRALPITEAWKEATKISLMCNEIQTMPNCQFNFPNLSTLLLSQNPQPYSLYSELYLPESFFSQMRALRLLDLSFCNVSVLPSSLSDLTDLRALFLKFTTVRKMPSVAEMEKLQMLNLEHSSIEELPEGIDKLVSLRYLNLSNTCMLEKIQHNVICELTSLEVLHMQSSKFLYTNSLIREMASLNQLTTLTMTFCQVDDYLDAMEHIKWDILKSFCIELSIYHHTFMPNYSEKLRFIGISDLIVTSPVYNFFPLPDQTEELHFEKCQVPALSAFLLLNKLKSLKCCYLKDCKLDDCLVSWDEVGHARFPTLEELNLQYVEEVRVLWEGVVPNGSLANLKILKVSACHSLKTLFSYETLQHLKNIEVMQASDCNEMEAIAGPEQEDSSVTATEVNLPKLHTLILDNLPKLHYISRNAWVCASLKNLSVLACPRLEKLPFKNSPAFEYNYG